MAKYTHEDLAPGANRPKATGGTNFLNPVKYWEDEDAATLNFDAALKYARDQGYTGPENKATQFLAGMVGKTGTPNANWTQGSFDPAFQGGIEQGALLSDLKRRGVMDDFQSGFKDAGSSGFGGDWFPALMAAGMVGAPAMSLAAGGAGAGAAAGGMTIPADVAAGYGAAYGGTTPNALAGMTGATGAAGAAGGAASTLGIPNSLWSGLAQGGLGYLGAGKQADAFRDVSNQNLGLGAPFRNELLGTYGKDFNLWDQPGFAGAFDRSADIAARQVSADRGNPFGNPGAMGEIQNQLMAGTYLPALANYRGQLGQFGGLGLNTAGQSQLMGAGTAGNQLDALSYGIGTAFPQASPMDDFYKAMTERMKNQRTTVGGMVV